MAALVRAPKRLLVLHTACHDPFWNIATEEHLFNSAKEDEETLFLWRNAASVILGRNQNPWKECRLDEMQTRGVELVRRHSGGGAVYHDLGNTNFSFVGPRSRHSKDRNCAILLAALKDPFGIPAELKGRNDVVWGETKISGHAYKYTASGALHHGTLLREADMGVLAAVLSPHKAKLQSKGVASVAARVSNLASQFPGLTHEAFCAAMERHFAAAYADVPVERHTLRQEDLAALPGVKERRDLLLSWDWRYGESPSFSLNITKKFPWGLVDLYLDYEGGRVKRSKLYSDALLPDLVAALQAGVDAQVSAEEAKRCLPDHPELHGAIDEYFAWVNAEIKS
jgi:lipoate-protein ligase A